MIGDVQHQQLLIARGVLLVDLAAEAGGVAGRSASARSSSLRRPNRLRPPAKPM